MSSTIQVAAARIPDRDRLLRELQEHGLDARAVDEIGIEVRSEEDEQTISNEVFNEVERVVMSIGAQFVPTKHHDVIYIRPPVG
ncbi:MAG TPA: hypothetical protein VNY33_01070 [Gaiellaceae bacterium]|nr:hypothetical protein [Gaiellaceae bacterium]